MRKDENGNECPETLKEYRDLFASLGGEGCKVVELLDEKIQKYGEDDKVIIPDSQMRSVLMLMLL